MSLRITHSLAVCLLAAPALAQGQPHPLDALDAVSTAVVEKTARGVVLLEVERPNYGPRDLTLRERAELGVVGGYDPRYFTRPEGPCAGVVVARDQIATCSWNLEGDGAVTVVTPDGRRLPAQRLGKDENLDLALLGVKDLGIEPLPLAPEEPVVGRFVLLVGRAPDQRPTCTQGIVSGLGRYSGDAFAHSARTNYETAGGALVDLEGRLMGVSTRHGDKVRQGQVSGVGFAAPMKKVGASLPTLARGESIARRQTPFLGIQPDQESNVEGVMIGLVLEGSAAEKAGIKKGDVIKIFNQVEVKSFGELREEIRALAVGQAIVVTVARGQEQLDIKVQLGGRMESE